MSTTPEPEVTPEPDPAKPADDSYPPEWAPRWIRGQADDDDVIFRGQ